MKKLQFLFLSFLFLSLFVYLAGGKHNSSTQVEPSIQEEYVPDEVLVKFKKDVGRSLIQYGLEAVQGRIKTYLGLETSVFDWDAEISTSRSFLSDPELFQIKVPKTIGAEQAIYLLGYDPHFSNHLEG